DANGEVLADNEPVHTVVADGSLITRPAEIAELLAKPLGLNARELEEKLATERKYVVIKKHVQEAVITEIADALRERSLRGILFERDSRRIYPNGQMLAHVLGFMDHEHAGVHGVEKTMDAYLRGYNGYRFIEHDPHGRELVA